MEIENRKKRRREVWRPRSSDHLSLLIDESCAKITRELNQRGYETPGAHVRGVVEEAVVNAWRHGNQRDPAKSITVRQRYGNDFHFEVIDEGPGFDFSRPPDPRSPVNLLKESGRGIFIIQRYSDDLTWESGGSHLVASFKRNSYFKAPGANGHHRPLMPLWRNSKKKERKHGSHDKSDGPRHTFYGQR